MLVVNDSLKMQKGKIAAQAGHATLACALMLKDANPRVRPHLYFLTDLAWVLEPGHKAGERGSS